MKCDETRHYLYVYLDGEATILRRWRMWRHFRQCPHCEDGFVFEVGLKVRVREGCREEMPRLAEASQQAKRVSFVGINTQDDPEFAGSFLADVGVRYPQLVDSDGAVLDSTRIPGLPVTLVLDVHGTIVGRVVGEASEEELADLIEAVGG